MPDQTLTLLPVADARALLLARLAPLAAERVAVSPDLAGRVLAEPVRAPTDIPRFANSAMDGYALRAADARAGAIPVAFAVAAGDDPPALPPGACAQIATGAPLPEGADAIVPVERSSAANGTVELEGAVASGDFVRTPGEDVRAGDEVLPAGTQLGPLALAAIAAVGADGASVVRRPRVAMLTTGDELVPPGRPVRRGQIHESNSAFVIARCRQLGAEVVLSELVPDDREATKAAFERALAEADLVLSSGGVSMGPLDHVKPALDALGVERLFWRIALQPGKPAWAGLRDGVAVLGLPGNPLSVVATLELLARPAIARLGGLEPGPPVLRLPLLGPVRRNAERLRALPARMAPAGVSALAAGMSHQIGRAASADALVLIEPGSGDAPAGDVVDVVPF